MCDDEDVYFFHFFCKIKQYFINDKKKGKKVEVLNFFSLINNASKVISIKRFYIINPIEGPRIGKTEMKKSVVNLSKSVMNFEKLVGEIVNSVVKMENFFPKITFG